MERDQFADISWQTTPHGNTQEGEGSSSNAAAGEARPSVPSRMASGSGNDGAQGDPLDLAGIGHGSLECTVSHPLKENDGSKDAYVSFQVTTKV
jgi:sorting nexin-4